jgi:putative SOS response-associated peptidase YedK
MCGRYAIAPSRNDAWATMGELLGARIEEMLAALQPQFNIAPSTQIPIIRQNPQTREIEPLLARWGFIPHWWKEIKPPTFSINARQEEAATKPMWRDAYVQRRCLIPATHWYEWRQDPAGKQPFALTAAAGESFCFAGLYSKWKPPGSDEAIYTAAIITRPAAESIAQVHDRMPVILHPQVWRAWLDPATQDKAAVKDILEVHAILAAKSYRISAKVNTPRNQGPEILDPLPD